MAKECVFLLVILFQLIDAGTGSQDVHGTVLYKLTDVDRKTWTDADRVELQCRKLVGSLIPGANFSNGDGDGERFLEYFSLIKGQAKKIVSSVARKRAMIAIVDALGGYLHTKLLPNVREQYYAGRATYSTVKRLHDLEKNIKYVLKTDGRGWAKPIASDQRSGVDVSSAMRRTAERTPRPTIRLSDGDDGSAGRCGGVDVSPYGLLRPSPPTKTAAGAADVEDVYADRVPFFDNDTRPHSLVVPWRQGRAVLYGVRDAGCHQALFGHLATATAADMRPRRANLRQWLDQAVLPLVTTRATDRWYPALWGVTLVARRLEEADVSGLGGGLVGGQDGGRSHDRGHHQLDCDWTTEEGPGHNFYAAIVLASAYVCWLLALYIR
ncbi:uncharacterized protein LOC111027058 [Myzus persicae]|uniref:uncharacterized protein LOC111027058 n=1 Tax=Myzus persicae TaxID=13164 RepID=UPI000B93A077|nr:uncharacterized protein LOC111027058 [Myzus persicae]